MDQGTFSRHNPEQMFITESDDERMSIQRATVCASERSITETRDEVECHVTRPLRQYLTDVVPQRSI